MVIAQFEIEPEFYEETGHVKGKGGNSILITDEEQLRK